MCTLFKKLKKQTFGLSPKHLHQPGTKEISGNPFELPAVGGLLLSFSLASWYWMVAGIWINVALLK